MGLIKPQLTVVENSKLYLSRRPGFLVWFILGLSITLFVEASRFFVNNICFLAILFLGGIVFGLDIVGDWEDIILDRDRNIATVTKYIWSEKLVFNKSEKSLVINLADICHVGVSQNMGLFFITRNGRTVTFNVNGLSRDEVQNMKRKITFFLNVNRIKYAEPFTLNLHENLLNGPDRVIEEFSFKKCHAPLYLRPLRSNENVHASVHKRLSTPTFGSHKTIQKLLRNDSKMNPSHYSTSIKHRSAVPKKSYLEVH